MARTRFPLQLLQKTLTATQQAFFDISSVNGQLVRFIPFRWRAALGDVMGHLGKNGSREARHKPNIQQVT
ncbi:MAG: hypothetical protein VST67_02175 [Nitrospirota bacterium]|nr:hypothetical protein [Nitrospirota bacterium]